MTIIQQKLKKVNQVDESYKVDPNEQHKNANKTETVVPQHEVILDNVKFGYNKETEDFFVKITKGSVEQKYPSEEFMKLKQHFKEIIANLDN